MSLQRNILMIYTGGTIGMVEEPETGALKPFDFDHLLEEVPELKKFPLNIHAHAFKNPIDSSDMQPEVWQQLAQIISQHYSAYDGFVILHGSDTMAFTASALSFMLEGLNKPVILTGSQLPIGKIRTDGKENLITAVEIAAHYENDLPVVPEVSIYFEYQLYRGNRTFKYNAENFKAFISPNYQILARAGVHIKYNDAWIRKADDAPLQAHYNLDNNVAVLTLFPGISANYIQAVLHTKGLRAVIVRTFGSGNATTQDWFIQLLAEAIKHDIIVLNVTQCAVGTVDQGKYETSSRLKQIGVISGRDITFEGAITKLMHLLGNHSDVVTIKHLLETDMRGEVTL